MITFLALFTLKEVERNSFYFEKNHVSQVSYRQDSTLESERKTMTFKNTILAFILFVLVAIIASLSLGVVKIGVLTPNLNHDGLTATSTARHDDLPGLDSLEFKTALLNRLGTRQTLNGHPVEVTALGSLALRRHLLSV